MSGIVESGRESGHGDIVAHDPIQTMFQKPLRVVVSGLGNFCWMQKVNFAFPTYD
jgi:hypothetical protein